LIALRRILAAINTSVGPSSGPNAFQFSPTERVSIFTGPNVFNFLGLHSVLPVEVFSNEIDVDPNRPDCGEYILRTQLRM
jgi:hypothetical protein